MIISCYGDSNTRYYLGDKQQDGPDADSYPALLQQLFRSAGRDDVTVLNCGYPDMQTDFGVAHFGENVTAHGADVCILGYGTNNIRQPDADLDRYLSEFETLLQKCAQNGVKTAALLIPWYAEDYCGIEGQRRIPVWNEALKALCARWNTHVLDTYTPFAADPDRYFNETQTPKRHYSPAATREIAQMAFDWLQSCR